MRQRWIVIPAMTGGRPQTGVDLAPSRFSRDSGIVDLNPAMRRQNEKYRAKVKAGRISCFLLNRWEKAGLDPYGDRYCGYSTIEGVKSALQRVAADTGIPVSTYSWRRKMITGHGRSPPHRPRTPAMLPTRAWLATAWPSNYLILL